MREVLSDPKPDQVQRGTTLKHVRRGTIYMVVYRGLLQVDGPLDNTPVVVYRGQDMQVWVRPIAEVCDGRFKLVRYEKEIR